MTIPTTIDVFITIRDGSHQYYLLKIVRRGFDVYCIPPHLGLHYSVHESGEAHFRFEEKSAEAGDEDRPPVILQGGEAGTPIEHGVISAPLRDLGRASGICTALFPIESLSSDFREFQRSARECFVIDADLMPEDTSWVEIGIWTVPKRNQVSFEFNNPDIPAKFLHKINQGDPQIWIYARPLT